jgi:hypothetical protein
MDVIKSNNIAIVVILFPIQTGKMQYINLKSNDSHQPEKVVNNPQISFLSYQNMHD